MVTAPLSQTTFVHIEREVTPLKFVASIRPLGFDFRGFTFSLICCSAACFQALSSLLSCDRTLHHHHPPARQNLHTQLFSRHYTYYTASTALRIFTFPSPLQSREKNSFTRLDMFPSTNQASSAARSLVATYKVVLKASKAWLSHLRIATCRRKSPSLS